MFKVDKTDIAILEAMQRDGRLTRVKLSEVVGLSPTPCHERLKRLEKQRLIQSYHAKVDVSQLAKVTLVYVTVTLGSHRAADFTIFERNIKRYPEVLECNALGGGIDYILKVVAHSIEDYQAFMEGLLESNIGIHEYYSHFVTKPVKEYSGYPLTEIVTL
ncbi:Lrp/AsnC family transcriptional regulator [Kordiimonas lacus]|uniref:Lrp/AsnC family transcriptional regulator, regulator of ectoine-degradation genes n=1 Tax=Kordiimonas lacus TaxID=637679 RepID=A0A1G7FD22_9PROT|nr:Lrp/AsnC family transcriptional regulator [Kordiimonas lacus]SDE73744.1 Lrp/AsnC family transcriptional regulator, regulator of ectoine-degradation genes [Kordiimonas lacus]